MFNWLKLITVGLLSLFLLSLAACGTDTPDTPDILSPTIMVNNVMYFSTGSSVQVDDKTATGYIMSTVRETEYPTQNDEANIKCLNAPYCVIEEGVAVFLNDNWILFEELK